MGRASRKSAVLGYKALEKPRAASGTSTAGSAIIGCYLLMMYYTTVAGWMLDYFVQVRHRRLLRRHGQPTPLSGVFGTMLANPGEMAHLDGDHCGGWASWCAASGLQNGLERISKCMMMRSAGADRGAGRPQPDPVRRCGGPEVLSGARLWRPSAEVGIGNVIAAAMNQSFFTLSLGIAAMEIFGSYMSKDHTLAGEGRADLRAGHLRGPAWPA